MARTFVDEGIRVHGWKVGEVPALPGDFEAITEAEWATGIDFSPQMVAGNCTLEFTDPETINEQAYSEPSGASQTPTKDNFNVDLQLFGDRTAGVLSASDPRKRMKKREEWYFAQRAAVPYELDPEAGQDYTFYKVMVTVINDLTVPDGATEKVQVKTLPRAHSGRGTIVT